MATFRVISESNVRQLGPLSAGPVRPSEPKVGACWIKPLPNPPTCVHGDQVMVSIVGVLHTNSSWFYSPFCGANIQLFP